MTVVNLHNKKMLTPFIVGKWDGNHIWLQWTPTQARSYALRLRYLKPGRPDWTGWIETHTPWPLADYFLKIATHAQGTRVQAQVAPWPEGKLWKPDDPENEGLQWETALARSFGYCTADFEFTAARQVTFSKDDVFAVTVDRDVAAYHLLEDLTVPADTAVPARMRAIQMSGCNQLDHPDHFVLLARPGVQVRNISASDNDLRVEEGDAVGIESALPGGPMTIAFGAVNQPST